MNIKYNDTIVEQVQHYSYLGILISSNGSFRQAEHSMAAKSKKALFKLQSLLANSNIMPSTCLRLFDQLIKPIAVYGPELWGIDGIKLKNISQFYKSIESFASEKNNLAYSRFILAVHKKSQNTAVRGELARFPLGLDIITSVLAYYKRFEKGSVSSLLTESYELSSNITKSWVNKSSELKLFLGEYLNNITDTSSRKYLHNSLQKKYEEHWEEKIQTEPKMRTYVTFKNKFMYENYLDSLNFNHRRSFTRLRISAHNLPIERGRYTSPKTPEEKRICPHCPSHIGNEIHFITECSHFETERNTMYCTIIKLCPNFSNMSNIAKFMYCTQQKMKY